MGKNSKVKAAAKATADAEAAEKVNAEKIKAKSDANTAKQLQAQKIKADETVYYFLVLMYSFCEQ